MNDMINGVSVSKHTAPSIGRLPKIVKKELTKPQPDENEGFGLNIIGSVVPPAEITVRSASLAGRFGRPVKNRSMAS